MHPNSHDTTSEMVEAGTREHEEPARAKKKAQSNGHVAKEMESYVVNASATKSVSQSEKCCVDDSKPLESNASDEIATF